MSVAEHDEPAGSRSTLRCAACEAPLAHDQRYCVECGARRGPPARQLAAAIAAMLEQGRGGPASSGPTVRPDPDGRPAFSSLPAWMPAPRAAAASVLAMLGFGALVGSLIAPGVASTLGAPVQVLVSLGSAPPAVPVDNLSASDTGVTPLAAAPSFGGSSAAPTPAATATPQTSTTASIPNLSSTPPIGNLPPIKHVFLIVLSDQGYGQTFGSTNKYLGQTLPKQGGLVPNYYAATAGELANGVALISGQGPTPQTASDCPEFTNVTPGRAAKLGQVLGTGCVYPAHTKTLADELSAPRHGGWKAYVEGLNRAPHGEPIACRHPVLGGSDRAQVPRPNDPYVTWRNPFVYFHSLIDGRACQRGDVALPELARDVRATSTTPALSYLVPSPCDDGSDRPCQSGVRAGLAPAVKFLQSVVPEIERSPAYKSDGLIAITFDQAPQTGPHADATGCCGAQAFPNLLVTPGTTTTPTLTTTTTPTTTSTPAGTTSTSATESTSTTTTTSSPTTSTMTTSTTQTTTSTTPTTTTTGNGSASPAGGGQVGILLISRYVKPGSVDFVDSYNHFSLLATIEKLLGVSRLGYTSDPTLPVFGVANFNNY